MTTGSVRRSALLVLGCGTIAVVAAAVPPTGGYEYAANDRSLYDVSTVFQLALLLVAGATLLVRDRVAPASAQRSASSPVGSWPAPVRSRGDAGTRAPASTSRPRTRPCSAPSSLVLTAAGCAAVVVCLVVLRRDGLFHRLGRRRGLAIVGVTAALALAIAVPLAMGHEYGNRGTQLAAHALMYGLPWAFAVLIGTLADRLAAVTAVIAVIASAVPLLGEILMIPAERPAMGFVVAAAVGTVVAVVAVSGPARATPQRRPRPLPVRLDARRRPRR